MFCEKCQETPQRVGLERDAVLLRHKLTAICHGEEESIEVKESEIVNREVFFNGDSHIPVFSFFGKKGIKNGK